MSKSTTGFWAGLWISFLGSLLAAPGVFAQTGETGWPRTIHNSEQITIYQPQVETWKDNQIQERAAVSIMNPASAQPSYGVIWLRARTEVDKTSQTVTLEDIQVTHGSFPSTPSQAPKYLALLRKNAPSLVRTVALARLQADLAITQAESRKPHPALKNTPPQILYSQTPAVLVLVDGDPVLRDTGETGFLRVINTRALMVFDQDNGRYYLYLGNRWMQSASDVGPGAHIRGQWVPASHPPAALTRIKQSAVADKQVDLLNEPDSSVMRDLSQGTTPEVFVATGPAELIQTQGNPDLQPVTGTQLLAVQNTENSVFLDPADQNYYVLLSGRWYRSRTLDGPWLFVSAHELPHDFAKIPEANPKGTVLASVAGTPQAREAGIANEIPQTATVSRSGASVSIAYDGAPAFEPIPGTPLQYVINSRNPVIEVDPHTFYAVENGVWFAATSPQGPWVVATEVPAVIYTIPPSSPMYYVTFVKIYGSTPVQVYEGYTPGYLGAFESPDGVVVYGTGYWYTPWIGAFWVEPPLTFGFGWAWGVGFGWAILPGHPFYPWWGPWRGWGLHHGPPVVVRNFGVNHMNIYRSWNSRAVVTRSYAESRRSSEHERAITFLRAEMAMFTVTKVEAGRSTGHRDGIKRRTEVLAVLKEAGSLEVEERGIGMSFEVAAVGADFLSISASAKRFFFPCHGVRIKPNETP